MNIFGERLRNLRLKNNLTKLQLANYIKVSVSTINRWEKGIYLPLGNDIYNLATFFNVSADYLLGLGD